MADYGLLLDALGSMGNRIVDKYKANKQYKTLVPMIKKMLHQGTPYNDPIIQNAVKALADTAPMGLVGRNFERRYLRTRDDFLRLPDDPDRIMWGYWW
ncbi:MULTISPECIES: hypothetical protein [Vibrio]|uniref:hypothetical protein n=1 Tax=Vibrio TaxID=662 RepID=UPI002075330D|nr:MULTISPECIES: hypothetical protein [Vibrio]USD32042.1 hypothetical protein J8Z27_12405 [Vibrio sp. SCSIO 43186]USD45083.1 hypothetical protein J4N38_12795 [Vibrio sp. SCSIO 43145]USD69165.1 hypothetical protein J4N41_12405 [Vibrio sp. SCSIO 43139]USD96855.1 hypothetical protein CTT30_12560 [Vibrio coralliilyticus]